MQNLDVIRTQKTSYIMLLDKSKAKSNQRTLAKTVEANMLFLLKTMKMELNMRKYCWNCCDLRVVMKLIPNILKFHD